MKKSELIIKYNRMLSNITSAIEKYEHEPKRLQGRVSILKMVIKDLEK